jgi:integrase
MWHKSGEETMATFEKREGKRGTRWMARVRKMGREKTRTFATKGAAASWARSQEIAIETGDFRPSTAGVAALLADAIDAFRVHRKRISRQPGRTFDNALDRLKEEHGLEPLSVLSAAFWYRHALDRIEAGAAGSTVAGELAYAGSVLALAARDGHQVDAKAPGRARSMLADDGIAVVSKQRKRRLNDKEIASLLEWFDKNAARTHIPMRDLVEFALATGLRRGEILSLQRSDISGRVMTIKRKHPRERDRMEEVPLLKPHADWPRVDPLAIIERQPKQGKLVFPYLGDTVGFWFEKACEGAALKDVVFHVLRHECLSRLADRGFDPLRLALIGGHRDLRNVKRYAKLDAARLANE